MPIEITPSGAVDITPPTTTPDDMVSDYQDLMAAQAFRKNWREGTNSAEHFTPEEMAQLYDLKKRQELDAARASGGIFRRIVD